MKKKTMPATAKSSSLENWLSGSKILPAIANPDSSHSHRSKQDDGTQQKSSLKFNKTITSALQGRPKIPTNKFRIEKPANSHPDQSAKRSIGMVTVKSNDAANTENLMPGNEVVQHNANEIFSLKSSGCDTYVNESGSATLHLSRSKAQDEYEQQLRAALEESARESMSTTVTNYQGEIEYPQKKICLEKSHIVDSEVYSCESTSNSQTIANESTTDHQIKQCDNNEVQAVDADMVCCSTTDGTSILGRKSCSEDVSDYEIQDGGLDESPILESIVKKKMTFAELVFLKQQAITDFIIAGGTRKPPTFLPRPSRHFSDPRCMTPFGFVCRTPQPDALSSPPEITAGYLKSEAASLCARRLRSAPVRFQRSPYGGARVGVSAVRFDARGDLVAVAGSNGIIRVFEFLECLGRLQAGSTAEVPAVVVLDAKKDVADLSWSSLDADDIAVAFTSLSWVHIYDLGSDSESPKLVLEAPRGGGHGVVQYVLEPPGADDGSEGAAATAGPAGSAPGASTSQPHVQAKNATKPPAAKATRVSRVLAGSNYGKIRLWSCSRPGRPLWEIPADPHMQSGSSGSGVGQGGSLAVVSLCQRPERGQLVALNKAGVVCIFDVINLKVASFASNGSPVCLQRLDPWGPQPQVGLGAAMAPGGHMGLGLGSHPAPVDLLMSATDAVEESVRLVASSGQHIRLDLRTQQLSPPLTVVPPRLTLQEDDEAFDAAAAAFEKKLLSAPFCNAAFLPLLRGTVSCVGVHGSTLLQLVAPGHVGHGSKTADASNEHSGQVSTGAAALYGSASITLGASVLSAVSSTEMHGNSTIASQASHLHAASSVMMQQQPVLMAPPMRKIAHTGLRLPGHVIEAEPGSADVIVSQDLRAYLASRAAAASSLTRSDRVYFDWTPQTLLNSALPAPFPVLRADSISGKDDNMSSNDPSGCDSNIPFVDASGHGHLDGYEASLSYITGYTLTLTEPYFGPAVQGGKPRISLKTNLTPTEAAVTSASSKLSLPALTPVVLSELQFSQPATALSAHPSLPFVLAGFVDDSIALLAPLAT